MKVVLSLLLLQILDFCSGVVMLLTCCKERTLMYYVYAEVCPHFHRAGEVRRPATTSTMAQKVQK